MKTLAEIEKIKEELAQSEVNKHCGKSDVVCITTTSRDFKSGFDACLALMLEREKVAKDYFDRIQSFCDHCDQPDGELCECSTYMTLDARKALEKLK